MQIFLCNSRKASMVHAWKDMSIIGPVFCCMCNIETPLFVPVCLNTDLAWCGTCHHTKSICGCYDLLLCSNGRMIWVCRVFRVPLFVGWMQAIWTSSYFFVERVCVFPFREPMRLFEVVEDFPAFWSSRRGDLGVSTWPAWAHSSPVVSVVCDRTPWLT